MMLEAQKSHFMRSKNIEGEITFDERVLAEHEHCEGIEDLNELMESTIGAFDGDGRQIRQIDPRVNSINSFLAHLHRDPTNI
mmetsp:Transcript_11049/g.9478  ORF Transcript_11049/g.9478 Transcript_11049/m.9478 type:complete len:82 (+) Transcript_11049:340-585(+)